MRAALYHFGSRDALIDAILERHSAPIHARWASQLDLIERMGSIELRALVEMLVIEIASKLDDEDGGFEYLSICGELLLPPTGPLVERQAANTPTVQRLVEKMLPYYAVPAALLPMRFERLVSVLYTSLIGYRRRACGHAAREPRGVHERTHRYARRLDHDALLFRDQRPAQEPEQGLSPQGQRPLSIRPSSGLFRRRPSSPARKSVRSRRSA